MRGIDFNKDWKFFLGETKEAHITGLDDKDWKMIHLPHDWSVEQAFEEKWEPCTGYLPGGIGWYRKHFLTTQEMREKKMILDFDGIYNRAAIYCNGEMLKFHPYGYSPCLVDITEYLNPEGEDNCVAIHVDHSRYADSRWYTGSGIYRKVSYYLLPKVHIPVWGTFFQTTEITKEKAVIKGEILLENDTIKEEKVELIYKVYSPLGEIVYEGKQSVVLEKKEKRKRQIVMEVENPILWDIYEGKQYKIQLTLYKNEEKIQEENTYIGIRKLQFDVNHGFFLNEKNLKIKGVCLHHDGGLVGAAVPKEVWKRRLERLKACGCNAIRIAHNPASEDFLDLCDDMGFLVQEEFYDEWDNPKDKRNNGTEYPEYVNYYTRGHAEFFQEYAKEDLQNTMRRDRNHPSIFQWSIGNEIEWTYPKYNEATGYFGADTNGNYFWTLPPYSKEKIRENISKLPREKYEIGKTAHKLADWTREMDKSRPVIANCILPSASYESGYTDALDIVGYSYRQVVYEYGHKNYPDKPIMGTENLGQWHEWKAVLEKEYVAGMFIWTGVDYMGEAGKGNPWPRKGSGTGMLDFAGFPKPSYHMFKTLWQDQPYIEMETQVLEKSLYEWKNEVLQEKEKDGWKRRLWRWHDVNPYWAYENGQVIVVEVYTNCEEVELYFNDKKISTKYLKDFEDRILKWLVPYEAGVLKAVGKTNGKKETEKILTTPGEFAEIKVFVDKEEIHADVDDVAHIEVTIVDSNGNPIRNQEQEISFKVEGSGKSLGIDNGDAENVTPYQSEKIKTYHGNALLIVQGIEEGKIEITIESGKIKAKKQTIEVIK